MDRRSFILGSGTLALSQLLAGCSGTNKATLRVEILKGSIPAQVVGEFRKGLKQPAELQFTPVEYLQTVFQHLLAWQQKTPDPNKQQWRLSWSFGKSDKSAEADLVTLGDYWLASAIQQKIIQPLEPAKLQQWSALDAKWQQLVTRNDQGRVDAAGKVWGAPYRWGSTVLVYRRDKFQQLGWQPQDWQDLWREELRDRISLLDHPREVIGLTLKKLGLSYNTENLDSVPNLETELRALHQQTKFYSSDTYLQPLIIGDTWLAVGWSNDVLPVMQRYQQLGAVIPLSGTSLWADLWVRPVSDKQSNLFNQWIDFCWQPTIAEEISILTKGNSPIPVPLKTTDVQESLRRVLLAKPEVLAKSEFLLPLSSSAQYWSLYEKVKM